MIFWFNFKDFSLSAFPIIFSNWLLSLYASFLFVTDDKFHCHNRFLSLLTSLRRPRLRQFQRGDRLLRGTPALLLGPPRDAIHLVRSHGSSHARHTLLAISVSLGWGERFRPCGHGKREYTNTQPRDWATKWEAKWATKWATSGQQGNVGPLNWVDHVS